MIKSMTAYARVCVSTVLGTLVLEIHSVNRKGLELALHFPREFLRFDVEVRRLLSSQLERGQVTCRLAFLTPSQIPSSYLPELKTLKEEWETVCEALHLDKAELTLAFLVSQVQSVVDMESQEEQVRQSLHQAVEEALKELIRMKQKEGAILAQDIEQRLGEIETAVERIALRKELPLLAYRRKIQERLQEFAESLEEDLEGRVAKEVALLSDKMDITEELVRLRAHLSQMREYLTSSVRSVGKTLDFLAQEMHREINTVGSKSQDGGISLEVIKIKSELDRIREQIQNIE